MGTSQIVFSKSFDTYQMLSEGYRARAFWKIWYDVLPLMHINSPFSSEEGKPQTEQTKN